MGKASRKKRTVSNAISLAKSRHSELPTSTKRGILYNPIFHILLIAIIGFMSYSNTFNVPFHFDDTPVIVENPIIKSLRFFIEPSEANVYSEHFQYPSFSMRYIGYLTFALNYRVHGLNVTGYHFVNLFIHIINGLLVYLLIVLTFRTPYLDKSPLKDSSRLIAIFAALLFVCHPVQTQAVTYIWQRVTSLATFFYLLSLVMYIKFRMQDSGYRMQDREDKTQDVTPLNPPLPRGEVKGGIMHRASWILYLCSLLSAILAMKTKEISFTLPLIIVLYEFMFFEGKIKKRILYLIPLLLTILIIPLSLIGTDKPIGDLIGDVSEATRVQTTMSRSDYLFTQFRVIVTYIRLLFLPITQNLDYDYPIYNSFLNPNVFLSFLFLLLIFAFGIYLLYAKRYTLYASRFLAFGIFWFFITLSVESSIIPIVDVIFEHRLYLPSVGVFIAITTSVFILASKLKRKWPQIEKTVTPVLALIIIILSGATYARNIVWQDEVRLWEDVIKKSPNKARGYNSLGKAYNDKGWIDEAIEQYQIALRLNPYSYLPHSNLGSIYSEKGWFDKAIESYQIALKFNPDNARTHCNIGIAYYQNGLPDKAIDAFQTSVRLKPDYAEAYNNLGLAYEEKKLFDKAIHAYHTALELNPKYATAYNNLGAAYGTQGMFTEAIHAFQTAVRLKPDYAEAYNNLGIVFGIERRLNEAIDAFQTSVRLKPDDAEAHYNLGVAYERKGLLEEAIKEYQTALMINPEFKVARENLNKLLRIKGK